MKKKIIMTIFTMIILLNLSACTTSVNTDIAATEVSVPVQTEEPLSQTANNTTADATQEVQEQEAPVTEAFVEHIIEPIWYMDSEGIKNKELGLQIKKESSLLDELCLCMQFEILTLTSFNSETNTARYSVDDIYLYCTYCDEDAETYAQQRGYQTGVWNDIPYAYEDRGSTVSVYFVKNGIELYTHLDYENDENLTEYINSYFDNLEIVSPCYEFPLDCLAFQATDGLYLPAFNLKLSTTESKHKVSGAHINCFDYDSATYTRLTLTDEHLKDPIYADNYVYETQNIQEVMDNFINHKLANSGTEYYAIEDIAEITLGANDYTGRGVVENSNSNTSEEWYFYSNTSTWSIHLQHEAGGNYQKYLEALELLE